MACRSFSCLTHSRLRRYFLNRSVYGFWLLFLSPIQAPVAVAAAEFDPVAMYCLYFSRLFWAFLCWWCYGLIANGKFAKYALGESTRKSK